MYENTHMYLIYRTEQNIFIFLYFFPKIMSWTTLIWNQLNGMQTEKKTSYLVAGNLPKFSCGCFHAGFPDDFRRIRSRHVLFHSDTQPSLLQVWRILITWNTPFRRRQVTWLPSPCCYFYWRFPDLFRHCLNLTSHGPSAVCLLSEPSESDICVFTSPLLGDA